MPYLRKEIRKKIWQYWVCCYFLQEKKTKIFNLFNVFVQSPPGRHPSFKYLANTLHSSRFA
jgi:hypothetical protein